MIKIIGFKKLKSGKKKYAITFEKNGKKYIRKFGSAGMSDFTIHKDKERRERYISRHKKDLRTKDPMKPGYLSMYILWNKPTLKGSLADYKKRLGVYNRTGKFPTEITGSKKLSFGTSSIIPLKGTLFDKLPPDVFDSMLQEPRSAALIQKNIRKRLNSRQKIINILKRLGRGYGLRTRFLKNLELNYRITTDSGTEITEAMVELLTKDDFLNKSFWWKLVLFGLHQLKEIYDDAGDASWINFSNEEYVNFEINEELLIDLVHRGTGIYFDDRDDPYWTNRIINTWNELAEVDRNSFGKKKHTKGSKIPDNVVNKALYSRIKAKIRKDVNKKKRRWGAYDSGRLVREYKAKGGKYSGSKGKTNLARWYKEKWVDACAWPKRKACGRKTKEKIAYCRPSKKVDSKTPKLVQKLTKAQIKSRCEKKKKSPLKRVTKFGNKIKFRQDMYNEIFKGRDLKKNVEHSLSVRCGNTRECVKRMIELMLSIYFTMIKRKVIKLDGTNAQRKKQINKDINMKYKSYDSHNTLNLKNKHLINEFLTGLQGGYYNSIIFEPTLANAILESLIT